MNVVIQMMVSIENTGSMLYTIFFRGKIVSNIQIRVREIMCLLKPCDNEIYVIA